MFLILTAAPDPKLMCSKLLFVFGPALDASNIHGVKLQWNYLVHGVHSGTGALRMVLSLLQNTFIDIDPVLESLRIER